MALLVVAYPLLAPPDDAWIQAIRAQYDVERYRMIAPHFTLIFPTVAIERSVLLAHITEQTIGVSPMAFALRCAMAVSDPLSATTHTFLVPDEGYSALVKLHGRLYTGVLTAALRLDLPFIPHIRPRPSEERFFGQVRLFYGAKRQGSGGRTRQKCASQGSEE